MDDIPLPALPEQSSPDYFRSLVRNCIETYKNLPNDAMCLDYNRVAGKLRALVLDDSEYQQETRNIYARQCLEELREIDSLAQLAVKDGKDEDEQYDPRNLRKRKTGSADKDMLTMRFKAVQMRREFIASLDAHNNASERDAANLLFVGMSRGEVERSARNELYEGDTEDTLNDLTHPQEEAPAGSAGTMRIRGQSRPLDDEDLFETLPDGEIVEK
jgi:hypothetical protein